jgi:alpha-methylacyl-CoA racemase
MLAPIFRTAEEMPHRAAPPLGADADAILAAAGYDAEAIAALRRDGAV